MSTNPEKYAALVAAFGAIGENQAITVSDSSDLRVSRYGRNNSYVILSNKDGELAELSPNDARALAELLTAAADLD